MHMKLFSFNELYENLKHIHIETLFKPK